MIEQDVKEVLTLFLFSRRDKRRAALMQCKNCGFPISENTSVCSNCGQEVKHDKDRPQNILFGRSKAKMLASLNMVEVVLSGAEHTSQPDSLSRFAVTASILMGIIILLVPLLSWPTLNRTLATSTADQSTSP